MNNHISSQQSLFDLPQFWGETVSTPVKQISKSIEKEKVTYTCSVKEFREYMELERSYISGRAAWLYKQLEQDIKYQEQANKALAELYT